MNRRHHRSAPRSAPRCAPSCVAPAACSGRFGDTLTAIAWARLAAAALLLGTTAVGTNASAAECVASNCGMPDRSGGGGGGGGAAVFIAMTDAGDTYQFADDFDGDSQEDEYDNCPFVANMEQIDSDGDGIGDACDVCVSDPDPNQSNLDGDAFGDACDADIDDDGIDNSIDNCLRLANVAQIDTDADGLGNVCDADDDNDGFLDVEDPCPLLANDLSTGALLESGECDDDIDGDGVESKVDNCPGIYNPERDPLSAAQIDSDSDGVGDACDIDRDGDGVPNYIDNCPGKANPDQTDRDRDGLGDAGVFGAGPGSCDPTECYIVPGDSACLDPAAAFNIALALATPQRDGSVHVGDQIAVLILSNRLNTLHQWTARLETQPRSSRAAIEAPLGAGLTEDGPQVQGAVHVVVDAPGEYSVEVSAELPGGDPMLRTVVRQKIDLLVEDDGASADHQGCNASSRAPLEPVWLFGLLVVFFVTMAVRRDLSR